MALPTGPLADGVPDGGHAVANYAGVTVQGYAVGDFAVDAQTGYTESDPVAYDPDRGLFYTQTVDQLGHATRTYMDAAGRTIRTEYADGSFAETLYSVEPSTGITQDQEGNAVPAPTSGSWYVPSGGYEQVTVAHRKAGDAPVYTYDLYDVGGELTDVWLPPVVNGSSTDTRLVNPHWQYTYDVAGNQLTQVSGNGNADGATASAYTTTWAYDQNGKQVSETLSDGERQSWAYNPQGQLAVATDFDGNTAAYAYYGTGPHAGLTQSVVYAGAPGSGKATQAVGYTYDDLNQQQTVSDASGTTTDSYDAEGDLTEEQTPEGTIFYTFDPATGQHTETDTADTDTVYGYDLQGRLQAVTVKELNGQALATPLTTTYEYDAAGNKTKELLSDGEVTAYGYDALNRLTGVTEVQGGTTLFSQTYVPNDDGTRASSHAMQEQPGGSTVTTDSTWAYDADGRLTGEAVTSSDGQSYDTTFAYDLDNNRTESVHTGPGDGPDETVTYGYNGNDELTGQTSSLSGTTTNGYDAHGSLTTSTANGGGGTTTYTYDARNKLVGYAVGGMTVATYVYDDAGDRVSETAIKDGVTTTTVYLTDTQNPTGYDQPMEEKASGTATPRVTYMLGDRVLAQANNAGQVAHLLVDGHGSTQQLTNASGGVTESYRCDAFGTGLNFAAAAAGTVFLFGGDAVYDRASGLYLHGNGVRATFGAVFLQRDTYAGKDVDPASLNRYIYAEADPVTGVDPSGHFLGALGAAATTAGEYATDVGEGLQSLGIAGAVVSAITYVEASIGEAIEISQGDVQGAAYFGDLQYLAYQGFKASAITAGLGFGLKVAGSALTVAGSVLTAISRSGPDYSAIGSTGAIGENALKALGGQPQVFFKTSLGSRYVDQLVNGIANESKVGYQTLTGDIPTQIAKDEELIQSGQVNGVVWHFFTSPVTGRNGPSGPLLTALQNAGIQVVVH